MFTQTLKIGMSHTGADNRLKLGAAVDIMQNASWFQMDTELALLDYFARNNCSMYMVSRQFRVERLPEYGETVTLKAWICDYNERFGYRNTVVYGPDGDVCLASFATAAYVDLASGRAIRIDKEALTRVVKEPAFEMTILPRKIPIPAAEPLSFAPVLTGPHHLDKFGHMNNARYVDVAADCLDGGFSSGRVRIEHKRPMQRGESIFPFLYRVSPGHMLVTLCNERREVAASLEFVSGD